MEGNAAEKSGAFRDGDGRWRSGRETGVIPSSIWVYHYCCCWLWMGREHGECTSWMSDRAEWKWVDVSRGMEIRSSDL